MNKELKLIFQDIFDFIKIKRSRLGEIKKFKDRRRKEIYSKIKLNSEQKRVIDDLYKKNYGKRVPYTWHRHFTAFTGNFDKNYFPELLFIPEFERFENQNTYYSKSFEDKNMIPIFAKFAGVKTAKTFISCAAGLYRDSEMKKITKNEAIQIVSNIGECFIKPTVDSDSGANCFIMNLKNGVDLISGKKINEIIKFMGTDFIIQEKLVCHSSISKIYSKSVNTFRIMTYRWKGDIYHVPVIMRIGQGGKTIDNAHAGGMFIAIDSDGRMHEKAFTEFKKEYTKHPDSGVVFKNYKIPLVSDCIKSAKKIHTVIPQVGCINWDFTINQKGEPVLIEANMLGGGIWIFEMAHGKGAFGERTPEILRWIRLMKKTRKSQRKKFFYGNMGED